VKFSALPALLAAGLAGTPQPGLAESTCRTGAKPMARVELLFGLSAAAGPIATAAWRAFLAREGTPRFPDGLTVLAAEGQWRNGTGRITGEPSRAVIIWYAPAPDADARIEAIRDAYKRRFHQESVLRVDGEDCVSF